MDPLGQDWPPPTPHSTPPPLSTVNLLHPSDLFAMVAERPKTDSYGDRRFTRTDFSMFHGDFWIFRVFDGGFAEQVVQKSAFLGGFGKKKITVQNVIFERKYVEYPLKTLLTRPKLP